MRFLGLLLALLLCTACDRQSPLAAREWSAWTLPPDGPTLPTPRSLAIGPKGELAVLDTAGRVLIYDAGGTFLRQWKMLDVSVGKPEGITWLADGRLVVCDTHYHRIAYFDEQGRHLKNFGQKGEGQSEFIFPVGITKDPAENLYICEYGGHDRVQKFTREGKFLLEFGSFGTGPGQFQRPSGVAWHQGRVFVTDAINHRVLIFKDTGEYLGLLGAPEPLAFDLPYDVSTAPDGTLYVLEYGAGRLTQVTPEGKLLRRFGQTGSGENEFATPWGLTVDAQNRIFVADTKNRRLVRLKL